MIDANHPYSSGYTPVAGNTVYVDLQTSQCNFNPETTTAYLKKCYLQTVGILACAGLVAWLQFGEVGWWFYPRVNGLAIGYASYTSPISIGTNSPHTLENGQRVINAGVLGNTNANGDFTITVTDSTHFTLDGSSGNGTGSTGTLAGGGMAYYDAYTLSGRTLGNWYAQDDDPGPGSYGDTEYLRNLLYNHIHTLATAIKGAYSSAKCEWLLPMDVNDPVSYWNQGYPYPQGGRLNNYVNIPSQYKGPNSDIDRVKIEALSWGLSYYNVDLTAAAIAYASAELSNPKAATAFLVPWSNGSCAWEKHYLAAVDAQILLIGFWAVDHLCLLSWPVTMPTHRAYSRLHIPHFSDMRPTSPYTQTVTASGGTPTYTSTLASGSLSRPHAFPRRHNLWHSYQYRLRQLYTPRAPTAPHPPHKLPPRPIPSPLAPSSPFKPQPSTPASSTPSTPNHSPTYLRPVTCIAVHVANRKGRAAQYGVAGRRSQREPAGVYVVALRDKEQGRTDVTNPKWRNDGHVAIGQGGTSPEMAEGNPRPQSWGGDSAAGPEPPDPLAFL